MNCEKSFKCSKQNYFFKKNKINSLKCVHSHTLLLGFGAKKQLKQQEVMNYLKNDDPSHYPDLQRGR